MDPYLYQIADEMLKYCKDRKTVAFLPLVKTSQKFCEILNRKGFRAAEVNGESTDRAQVLADYDAGRYNVFMQLNAFNRGMGLPNSGLHHRVASDQSEKSIQSDGGQRHAPRGKRLTCYCWTSFGNTERHELCHPASPICESEQVAKKMAQNLEKSGLAVQWIWKKQKRRRPLTLSPSVSRRWQRSAEADESTQNGSLWIHCNLK